MQTSRQTNKETKKQTGKESRDIGIYGVIILEIQWASRKSQVRLLGARDTYGDESCRTTGSGVFSPTFGSESLVVGNPSGYLAGKNG
jgi:hypothetical protein